MTEGSTLHLAVEGAGQGDQQRLFRYTHPGTGQEQSGRFVNEFETGTVSLKLTGGLTQDVRYRGGLLWNEATGTGFPGTGTELYRGQSANLGRDFSDMKADTRLGHFGMDWYLPMPCMILDTQVFLWETDGHIDFDQTIAQNRVLRLSQQERRYGGNLRLRQQLREWNTDWLVALESSRSRVLEAQDSVFRPDGSILVRRPSPFDGIGREIQSLVVQGRTLVMDEQLALLYGGRIDHYSSFGTQRTPRLGAIWRMDQRSALKALYGNAFRAAVGGELTASGNIKGNPEIRPETIDSYELVYMREFEHVKLEMVLFKSRWTDAIVTVPIHEPPFLTQYVNAGSNTSNGVEVLLHYQKGPLWWDWNTSYVRSRNENEDWYFTAFPHWIVNLNAGYRWSTGLELAVHNRVHVDAGEGRVTMAMPNTRKLPTYWRTDLQVSQMFGEQVRGRIELRNLFDRPNRVPAIWNTENGIPDERFSVAVGGEIRF